MIGTMTPQMLDEFYDIYDKLLLNLARFEDIAAEVKLLSLEFVQEHDAIISALAGETIYAMDRMRRLSEVTMRIVALTYEKAEEAE